jgi:hypothetical protein
MIILLKDLIWLCTSSFFLRVLSDLAFVMISALELTAFGIPVVPGYH